MDALTSCALLFAALLHASWNALVKGARDGLVQLFWIQVASLGLGAVLLSVAGLPPRSAWPWLGASVGFQQVYLACLATGYARGDLTVVYPIARGCSPLLVALAAAFVAGETLAPAGVLGLLAVSAGVLMLSLPRRATPPDRGVPFAVATAFAIAGYTVCDARGVRLAGDLAAYAGLEFVATALPLIAFMLLRRDAGRPAPALRSGARLGLLAGVFALSSYGLALWALRRAPAGPVSALRETSVLFAAWIGPWLLGEPGGRLRWLAAASIALGVALLQVG